MGFGANLFLVFAGPFILIVGGVLLYFYGRSITFWKIVGIGFTSLLLLVGALKFFTTPMTLDADDFYGDYIVDRSYFPGPEADWQYNHCRFTITTDNKIYLKITDKNRHIKTFEGKVKINKGSKSAWLSVKMNDYNHIIGKDYNGTPRINRSPFHFHLVFKSPWYHNMYFKKGKWKPLKKRK